MTTEGIGDENVWERARAVRGVMLDVDGVLTDGRITLDERGVETKSFNVKDGVGIRLLMRAGIRVAIISGRNSPSVDVRARDLGIEEVHQGVRDKAATAKAILERWNLDEHEAAFIGDDLPDMPVFVRVGLAVAVADASPEVKEHAHLVTQTRGGHGAVREAAEFILKAKGKWNPHGVT
jgi:3-deoxy-D-manno-octulosonate 8-phosphate phosphatase (KDO 8-P phosphatase)